MPSAGICRTSRHPSGTPPASARLSPTPLDSPAVAMSPSLRCMPRRNTAHNRSLTTRRATYRRQRGLHKGCTFSFPTPSVNSPSRTADRHPPISPSRRDRPDAGRPCRQENKRISGIPCQHPLSGMLAMPFAHKHLPTMPHRQEIRVVCS